MGGARSPKGLVADGISSVGQSFGKAPGLTLGSTITRGTADAKGRQLTVHLNEHDIDFILSVMARQPELVERLKLVVETVEQVAAQADSTDPYQRIAARNVSENVSRALYQARRECLCHRESGSHELCCGHEGGRNPDCPIHGDGSN